jgi:hypothetical protein
MELGALLFRVPAIFGSVAVGRPFGGLGGVSFGGSLCCGITFGGVDGAIGALGDVGGVGTGSGDMPPNCTGALAV